MNDGVSSTTDYEQPTYDAGFDVTSLRLRDGQSIALSYDDLSRLTAKDLRAASRMTGASQTGNALSFTYDALGRNLAQTGPLGTVASEWDLAGRRTRLTYPDAFYVTYDHLVTGEVSAIRDTGATSGLGVLASFAHDDLGRRTSLTRGNGTVTHYEHDPVSRLEELRLDLGGTGTSHDLTLTFAYNPAGQIVSNTRSNDLYAWAGHGSGTTSTTANGRNQIASWVSTLGHDAKGNITSDGSYSYTYSSENLLTSLTNPAGTVQTSSTYAYDPLMRLAVIDSSNSALDVQFGYDGQEMVYEGLSDNRTRRYVYGPGVDEPLVGYLVTGTGTSRLWYQADERGSIARLSNDSGTPGGTGKFDEYGIGGVSRFRYTGQYWLGDANLLYYRARVYDARLGRFLQPDPIGYAGGMNIYAYVGGDPVNNVDPLGLTQGPAPQPPGDQGDIEINGRRCTSGWTCYSPGSLLHPGTKILPLIADSNDIGDLLRTMDLRWRMLDELLRVPLCLSTPDGDTFSTAVAAGVAGARYADWMRRTNNKYREWGGRIRPRPGGYTFLSPVEGPADETIEFMGRSTDPGWYHGHTPGGGSQLSEVDYNTASAGASRYPGFVTVIAGDDGQVYSWQGDKNIGSSGNHEGPVKCE